MCGIIGLCTRGGLPVRPGLAIYRGLKRLEYRGYDSAGVAAASADGRIRILKGKGKIDELEARLRLSSLDGTALIGHTRWATHGAPSDRNAHPHVDCTGAVAVVHNGVIHNYLQLKRELEARGHRFSSDTDTEVVAHLIEEGLARGLTPYEAFREAVARLEGSYAIAALISREPYKIFFAKRDSPLIIGIGDGANFVASDIPAILEHTRKVVVARDGWVGYVGPDEVFVEDLNKGPVDWSRYLRVIEWSVEDAAKGGHPHFMIKEIMEQPRSLRETFYGISSDPAMEEAVEVLARARRVFVTAAGTSYYASLHFALSSALLAEIVVIPFIASEYPVHAKVAEEGDVLIVVSQSGETIDALKALRAFKERGALAIAVSNVVDSAIPRESDVALYTRAGPEIGVAATKTFTSQVLLLSWLAVKLARRLGELGEAEERALLDELAASHRHAFESIAGSEAFSRKLAEVMARARSSYYLSRGIGLPTAMEGALKLKEIAYVHAEAYPAGESKHGPIALVEEGFPVVFVVPNDEGLWKLLEGNVQEMKARGALTIGIAPRKLELAGHFDMAIEVPSAHWLLTPLTHVPPLQMIAYHAAVARGLDPDKPRNLAKTVTVE
ncbi:MAG: glutamine--fructose-6-phosphate transaminase (isomerizing) [Desulfurococcaceae archaeon]